MMTLYLEHNGELREIITDVELEDLAGWSGSATLDNIRSEIIRISREENKSTEK